MSSTTFIAPGNFLIGDTVYKMDFVPGFIPQMNINIDSIYQKSRFTKIDTTFPVIDHKFEIDGKNSDEDCISN